MQYNKKFYEKYGWKIVDEPLTNDVSEELVAISVRYYKLIVDSRLTTAKTVAELEDLVKVYPKHLPFKNHLYVAYRNTRNDQKATTYLKEIIEKHPNYPFAKINLANEYIGVKNYNKAAQTLGEPYSISNVTGDEFIHQTAFVSYYQTAINIELGRDDSKKARELHKILFDYDRKHALVNELGIRIMTTILTNPLPNRRAKNHQEVEAIPQSLSGIYLRDANGQLAFNHREVKALYFNGLDNIPRKTVKDILSLPRTTLIKDLEHVVADMILRFDEYKERDEDTITQSFGFHALLMLAELRAENSLPIVLDALKQDQGFNTFWFGEAFDNYLEPVLYLLARNQLDALKAFVTTENILCWNRRLAIEVAAQVGLNHPERREEVLAWFHDVIVYHLENPYNKGLIDSIFLENVIAQLIDLKAVELEADIDALYATGWIGEEFAGLMDEVKKELVRPIDPFNTNPLPTDIFDFYSGAFQKRRAKSNNVEFATASEALANPKSHDSYLTDLAMTYILKNRQGDYDDDDYDDDDWEPQLPIKRTEPKVGRNDPCPCGSGKKYKKCHGA